MAGSGRSSTTGGPLCQDAQRSDAGHGLDADVDFLVEVLQGLA